LSPLVAPADVDIVRRAMRSLARHGQRRVHFQTEGVARRRQIAAVIANLPVRCLIFTGTPIGTRTARQVTLTGAVDALIDLA
jgi:2-keto-3-deoxy-6-phosphogluconate aldolase